MNGEKRALIEHLRKFHPNLMSPTITWDDMRQSIPWTDRVNSTPIDDLRAWQQIIANESGDGIGLGMGCLPSSGLSDVPLVILTIVHRASHIGLYIDHNEDDWLCRQHNGQDDDETPEDYK